MELSLPSFAKVNLCLRVMGKRPDGYHNLETLLQTIDLHDDLHFSLTPGSFQIEIHATKFNLPCDQRNLIWKACEAFHKEFPIPNRIQVQLEKRIPVESGLGGGSSNAAVTLIALSRLFSWPLEERKLTEIASSMGADVPFFLTGGAALGTGKGDRIQPLKDPAALPLLLVVPSVTCSTAAIYRNYDEHNLLTATGNSIKIHLDSRPESLRDLVSRIGNDLERVVFALYPELDSIKKKLLRLGAVAASLTGSGSAIFALFENRMDLKMAAGEFDNSVIARFVGGAEYRSSVLGL